MGSRIIHNQNSKQLAKADIEALSFDKEWVITIEKKVNSRSRDQNALYWKWVTIIGNDRGEFKDDQHIILMHKHLEPKIIKHEGEVYEHYSTKKLKMPEMSEYMDKVSMWAASEGIILPYPEDLQRNE